MENIISLLLGGAITLVTTLLIQRHASQRERRAIALALAGEIGAILDIIKYRGYEEGLRRCLELTTQTKQPYPFLLEVKFKYTHIYESNAHHIGTLPPELAAEVARFYTFVFSLLEDAMNQGLKALAAEEVERFLREDIDMLRKVVTLGSGLIPKLEATAA